MPATELKKFSEMVYDFQYLPFSLGDILTWTVQTAVQADGKNYRPEVIGYRCRLTHPHPMQPFILPGRERNYLGELREAFRFNPMGLEVRDVTATKRPEATPRNIAGISNISGRILLPASISVTKPASFSAMWPAMKH